MSAGNAERIKALQRKFRTAVIPVAGSVEFTRRCNIRCVHCYLGEERSAPEGIDELDTGVWLRIIDQIAAAGCLDLLITGGEPLLRPDFQDLYTRARTKGLRITLFTNATLAGASAVALLRELPPAGVEISIYGACAQTHDRVTGVPGSFDACFAGIGRLARAGLRLTLKTVLMTLNHHEFDAMRQLAADHGARWRFDPAILPRLDGDRSPLAYRVSPEEAARRDIPDRERALQWRACYDRGVGQEHSERRYTCGAGLTNFHVGPGGLLLPCMVSRRPSRDLNTLEFSPAWREIVDEIDRLKVGAGYRCNACEKRNICSLCPPFHELECGSGDEPSKFLCALGDKRRERIYYYLNENKR